MSALAWAVLIGAIAAIGAFVVGLTFGRAASASAPVMATSTATDLPLQIIEALQHGVVVVDRDEQVLLANPAAEAMGVTARDRLALPELGRLVRQSTDARAAATLEFDFATPRGGRLPGVPPGVLSAVALPLFDDAAAARPRVVAVVLLLDDVTEEHRLEAVRRDFVANVSHELKTPVGALTLLAEAVQEASDDPEAVQRFAGRMQHEGVRLGRLVRELIELSRLQGAERLPDQVSVPLARVLDEAADRTRLAAEQAGIEVRLSCPDDLVVSGSESQLAMAVVNLIDNALAYSPADTRVAVNARAVDGGAPMVEISVSDQGIGIAEADQARVFERFYRVDPARSRQTGGTGLGLAIVKHVANNHGGSVAVWSAEGSGSTFTIRLPRVHSATESSYTELMPSYQGHQRGLA